MNLNFNIKCRRVLCCMALCLTVTVLGSNSRGVADDSATSPEKELVRKVIAAAGGDDKLLILFRMEERYNSGKERVSPQFRSS